MSTILFVYSTFRPDSQIILNSPHPPVILKIIPEYPYSVFLVLIGVHCRLSKRRVVPRSCRVRSLATCLHDSRITYATDATLAKLTALDDLTTVLEGVVANLPST